MASEEISTTFRRGASKCSLLLWFIKQNSTALNIIEYYNHKGVISLLNDTSHLEDWWESGLIQEKRDE